MRMHLELWLKDGGLEVFGPFDATAEAESIRRARYWCRNYCRSGKVKVAFIHLGAGVPIAAYRSRVGGGYQVARGFRVIGALALPNWRG